MNKKTSFLILFIFGSLYCMDYEQSPTQQINNQPEFYLDQIVNKTSKDFILMIGNQIQGIKVGETLDLFSKRRNKIEMHSGDEPFPVGPSLQKIRYLSNKNEIKIYSLSEPNKIYFLKISYVVLKVSGIFVIDITTRLTDDKNNTISSNYEQFKIDRIPTYEGYKIQLELKGDDLKNSIIDVTGSYRG